MSGLVPSGAPFCSRSSCFLVRGVLLFVAVLLVRHETELSVVDEVRSLHGGNRDSDDLVLQLGDS